jgi:hypothetical protein
MGTTVAVDGDRMLLGGGGCPNAPWLFIIGEYCCCGRWLLLRNP